MQRVTPEILSAMEDMSEVAPAHNPPYIAAMRLLSEKLPEIPLVAAFETGFHHTVPDRNRYYPAPHVWAEKYHIKRWGFHGASHRYIATRTAELLGRDDLRIISCHLGGSNSLCAIRNGKSVATSMGMSPQSGIAHNNRAGDFDPFAIPVIMRHTGQTLSQVLDDLAERSGLLGLSGVSGDVRDLEEAAAAGERGPGWPWTSSLPASAITLGSMLVELGGADVIVFTGGIGENGVKIRTAVTAGLEEMGIVLDPAANATAKGEGRISASPADSRAQIWVMPTNEELIVARQTRELQLLEGERVVSACSSPKSPARSSRRRKSTRWSATSCWSSSPIGSMPRTAAAW